MIKALRQVKMTGSSAARASSSAEMMATACTSLRPAMRRSLADVEATFGFAVWTPPGPGSYRVPEVVAPPGLTTPQPILVEYAVPATPQNCPVVNGTSSCVRDEDQSGAS